jgi:hypothetical protein
MKYLLLFLIFSIFYSSCKKDLTKPGEKIEIYLLQSYNNTLNRCEVDPSTAVLASDPLVANDDIISYEMRKYKYLISPSAVNKIKQLGGRVPFAFTIDKEVIFYGFNMPNIMSSLCEESITMDIVENNKMELSLGYPFDNENIDDKRNDARIVSTLSRQGKMR